MKGHSALKGITTHGLRTTDVDNSSQVFLEAWACNLGVCLAVQTITPTLNVKTEPESGLSILAPLTSGTFGLGSFLGTDVAAGDRGRCCRWFYCLSVISEG